MGSYLVNMMGFMHAAAFLPGEFPGVKEGTKAAISTLFMAGSTTVECADRYALHLATMRQFKVGEDTAFNAILTVVENEIGCAKGEIGDHQVEWLRAHHGIPLAAWSPNGALDNTRLLLHGVLGGMDALQLLPRRIRYLMDHPILHTIRLTTTLAQAPTILSFHHQ